MKDYVYNIIKGEQDRPIPERVLKYKLIQNHKNELGFIKDEDFFGSINDLIKEKKIKKTMSGSLVDANAQGGKRESGHGGEHKFNKFVKANVNMNAPVLKGVIHINSGGNGFISLTDKESAQWYVNKEQINNAQNGDTVNFSEIDTPSRGNLKDAFVREVIQHAKDMYVGEFIVDGDNKKVVLDDNKSTLTIVLDDYSGLVNGSKILVKIEKYEGNTAYGSLLKIIGHKSDVGVDILSIVYDNGIEPEFTDEAMSQAKKITLNISDEDWKIRTNLSEKPVITIDPATSKDFDDAFYCEKQANGKFLLAVQIADVSHYVTYQSPLDKSSIERGCSVYLIDRVIPMVPHNLSDDVCSLNPGVERMSLSCDMIINEKGEFEDIKVFPSIIKSHRRFSYDDVNEYFDNKNDFSKEEAAVKNSIDAGKQLSDILTKMKNDRGYINFNIPKAVIKVNEKGEPTEIVRETHGRAQKMIEDFMVAANEAVTIHANKKGYPFIYRIHDKPDEQRLKIFEIEAKKMNFKITTSLDDVQPDTISKWLVDNKDNPNLPLINMFLLRSMAKAKYDTKNIGHFGLASENYTHFTSPIRRYPDLIVHRIYWMWEFLKDQTSEDSRKKFQTELQELCELSSRNELRATKCEREVDSMKFAEYMMKHIGEQFDATITSVTNFGCYVQLENTIEGIIGFKSLGDDFYAYNEKTNELVGKNSGKRLGFGMKVRVECISADKVLRKIEFKLI